MHKIKSLFNVINHNLATINGTMSYGRITDCLISLSNTVMDTDTDEFIWSIGECGAFTLDDLITGAYWHFTEWHSGQFSKGYEALSALGRVYQPNMEMPDTENIAYQFLNDMAENQD